MLLFPELGRCLEKRFVMFVFQFRFINIINLLFKNIICTNIIFSVIYIGIMSMKKAQLLFFTSLTSFRYYEHKYIFKIIIDVKII